MHNLINVIFNYADYERKMYFVFNITSHKKQRQRRFDNTFENVEYSHGFNVKFYSDIKNKVNFLFKNISLYIITLSKTFR